MTVVCLVLPIYVEQYYFLDYKMQKKQDLDEIAFVICHNINFIPIDDEVVEISQQNLLKAVTGCAMLSFEYLQEHM